MEIFAQQNAVDGERVPLGGAVVVIGVVFCCYDDMDGMCCPRYWRCRTFFFPAFLIF